jgi:hypothetical protein
LSTRCGKPKLLSKDGGTITTPNDPIVHWDIARLRQKPTFRWTKGQSCTNFQMGPLKWGCSKLTNSKNETTSKSLVVYSVALRFLIYNRTALKRVKNVQNHYFFNIFSKHMLLFFLSINFSIM